MQIKYKLLFGDFRRESTFRASPVPPRTGPHEASVWLVTPFSSIVPPISNGFPCFVERTGWVREDYRPITNAMRDDGGPIDGILPPEPDPPAGFAAPNAFSNQISGLTLGFSKMDHPAEHRPSFKPRMCEKVSTDGAARPTASAYGWDPYCKCMRTRSAENLESGRTKSYAGSTIAEIKRPQRLSAACSRYVKVWSLLAIPM